MPPLQKGAARSAGGFCQGLCQSRVVRFSVATFRFTRPNPTIALSSAQPQRSDVKSEARRGRTSR
jgi:hypothetical protein